MSATPARLTFHCILTAQSGAAGAVVGVSVFSETAPINFGSFDAAFLTLFYVAGGDPWPDELPKFNEDGSVNWMTAWYILVYTVVEIWIVLQVVTCKVFASVESEKYP